VAGERRRLGRLEGGVREIGGSGEGFSRVRGFVG
jgi:predicted RNA-binding protein with TRAM domain